MTIFLYHGPWYRKQASCGRTLQVKIMSMHNIVEDKHKSLSIWHHPHKLCF